MMALVAQEHRELEEPKAWSHGLPLMYNSSMVSLLISARLRKFFPLPSEAWKVIFHRLIMLLLLVFLQKSQDILLGSEESGLNDFNSLSTDWWSLHLRRLGHFQNSMEFSWPAEKKCLSQIRYLLVVILELNGISEVQYKDVRMVDDGKYQ